MATFVIKLPNFISFFVTLIIIYIPAFCSGHRHRRKLLHQPFFVLPSSLPPPLPSPLPQPKFPLSVSRNHPFFPLSLSPPPPPPPRIVTATFPANVSSLSFSRPSAKPVSRKLFVVALALSFLTSVVVVAAAVIFLLLRGRKTPPRSKTESRRLVGADSSSSDKPVRAPGSNVSGEFLYLGTLRGVDEDLNTRNGIFSSIATSSARDYQRLSSPELRPLPPLPRHQPYSSEFLDQDEEEQFFSPNLSPNNSDNNSNGNNNNISSSPKVVFRTDTSNLGKNSFSSSISSSPIDSLSSNSPFMAFNLTSRSLNSNSPDFIKGDFRAQPISRNKSLNETRNSVFENDRFLAKRRNLSVPSAPPLPPPRFWEMFEAEKGGQVADDDLEREEEEESCTKPRLKPLHWDKVRASSDRAMVWDQIKSSSFQLNEEMIETLFMVNGPGSRSSENTQRLNQENYVLDPKKSQNIAILLRALNVTVDEVCEALVEGTTDTLGTELLESLLKMAPSEAEERKLKESKDDSPAKRSPAEKFLKTVIDIPFAFQRVDAMLYVSTFDSEVDYLKRSFDTLKAACGELKNSKMFRKLLDAVLQTGNRMNLGTNRGDARAFKLDTLLKLVDIKGTDNKTSLLHFVVQEISRAEGSTNQGSAPVQSDVEFRKLGLRVVSGLSSELDNVKKAADMDSDVLGSDVAKLSNGVSKIKDVLKVECGERFSGSMKEFLDRAEREIANVRSLERECLGSVKAITEYFHGESGKGDTRIFKVVRDFVSIVDCVCKEVTKVNDRGFVGLGLSDNSTTAFSIFPTTMLGKEPSL